VGCIVDTHLPVDWEAVSAWRIDVASTIKSASARYVVIARVPGYGPGAEVETETVQGVVDWIHSGELWEGRAMPVTKQPGEREVWAVSHSELRRQIATTLRVLP
jgi:hypothetical protein